MVVLFPGTKDQAWRWQTSNNDYGKFYMSLSREALGARCRADGLHAECNKKCEQLARELCELKSELDRLKVGSERHSPKERDGCRDPTLHNGDCLFSGKARMPCDDMFHTTHDIEYNGGRRTEPQVLEDHLKADHPRLVKKVPPLNPVGASCFEGFSEQGGQSDHDPNYGRGKVSKYWTGNGQLVQTNNAPGTTHLDRMNNLYRRPESPVLGGHVRGQMDNGIEYPLRTGSGGHLGGGHTGSGGLALSGAHMGHGYRGNEHTGSGAHTGHGYRGNEHTGNGGHTSPRTERVLLQRQIGRTHQAEPMRMKVTPRAHHGRSHGHTSGGQQGGARRDSSRERTLPPSQRYNFYRYYGFAGQGAKTSRGWNPK